MTFNKVAFNFLKSFIYFISFLRLPSNTYQAQKNQSLKRISLQNIILGNLDIFKIYIFSFLYYFSFSNIYYNQFLFQDCLNLLLSFDNYFIS